MILRSGAAPHYVGEKFDFACIFQRKSPIGHLEAVPTRASGTSKQCGHLEAGDATEPSVPTTAAAEVILTTGHRTPRPPSRLRPLRPLHRPPCCTAHHISRRAQAWQRPCAAAERIFNGAAAAAAAGLGIAAALPAATHLNGAACAPRHSVSLVALVAIACCAASK